LACSQAARRIIRYFWGGFERRTIRFARPCEGIRESDLEHRRVFPFRSDPDPDQANQSNWYNCLRMLVQQFDYALPPELIAQYPLPERDASRMMLLDRATGRIEDRTFRELAQILGSGDLLVFNNTKVFPARLLGRRLGTRAQKIGKNNPARREYLT